ncbi:16S rRNA (guanine(966)-N(2))-methyltransferase RsmD [Acinetobacter ursingii]|uniref:Ribosomal RNA small subunit methyltransferase D n=1 Tax=Acinetobacter ursingii TaxID=108980 RepID=A0AA46NQR3_9GAMM|nr:MULTISPECIES: 16S rRNA (guanine(966)-N(2))-methyltransferase RsmD [Acinetobacter]ECE6725637.1 16S rRNA (guanine(966)-N(2))-methyltransferase RsmD [Salmonella enterica subsp. enterica serovar Paratyphi A]ENV75542.1 RsmD family RNA methyltransferase [Acinetobacter ursingii DSM 16037 = CIP 107286]EXD32006.1 RNA methyltransferase, RsmD family [Acinetobacter sp. 479375]MCH2006083.1 16S rRNA (guanine(966)-N(2))-methyltransferase RsmD [Acinetobacter ursingii]MCU4306805.1 16S rRNA (guanine(966)-N(2
MKNQLRIIGGEWKRRVLPFASINGLRPTPDRVRETLFNWLMWDIPNATVLDVCTGSGALAFEALSRGASSVLMIEPDSTQAKILKQNIQLLNAQHCELKVATAQHILPKLNQQFDVVFLDPPYALELWQELSILIDPLLKDQAYIYVEADRDLRQLQLPASWQLVKSTKAGTVRAGLFQKT